MGWMGPGTTIWTKAAAADCVEVQLGVVMNRIKEIERINKVEVEAGVSDAGSWHAQYKSSA